MSCLLTTIELTRVDSSLLSACVVIVSQQHAYPSLIFVRIYNHNHLFRFST
jgi:hypothetical protein